MAANGTAKLVKQPLAAGAACPVALPGMKKILPGLVAAAVLASPALAENEAQSSFEQDREAILAMVGKFKVNFNFKETVALQEGYELRKPYHEEALELVKLVEDRGKLIILQHILLADDGLDVYVVKHWGQIWKYEDDVVIDYQGGREWKRRDLDPAAVQGTWTQLVTQTDDSPRYESWGKWVHEGNRSAWESQLTARPLPRREYSKRSDYQILRAINRHVITPSGWVHEQENRKWVKGENIYLCHERGLNTYERCEADFTQAEEQWAKTEDFWHDVRKAWAGVIAENEVVRYADEVDGKSLGKSARALAKKLIKGEALEEDAAENLVLRFTEQG